jgi:methylenetetrahydrofolate dehydrogenase (NADP+)/methenyltetrahydrofolate cyclohydrolase
MAILLKGSEAAGAIKERITSGISQLSKMGVVPGLGIVRVGEKPDDIAYERSALKKCAGLGIESKVVALPESAGTADLIDVIEQLNGDRNVHGILILRPLPDNIDIKRIKTVISPQKDIDCLNPVNIAMLFEGDRDGFSPCTPKAVMEIIDDNGIDLTGKRVTIVGRSMVVGKPLSMMMLNRNATVTICHTKTKNLPEVCKEADILVAAAGKAKMVTADFVSEGQIVIDVGINTDRDGNLCGDVDFVSVEPVVGAITPVPGGVGAVTTSVLAEHVVKAAMKQNNLSAK